MRLISCKIENFGNISDTEFRFNEDFTCICEKNGFGKSTLASFITDVFYGMEIVKSNTKDFNDRIHYLPFSGKKFGGSVTMEINGKEYIISRIFDAKSDKKDTVSVFENGTKVDDYEKYLGPQLFGLDKNSFYRTVFMNSENNDDNMTQGVTSKLTGLIDDIDLDIDKIYKTLEDSAKKLKLSRGKSGKIFDAKKDLDETDKTLKNLRDMDEALGAKYKNLEEKQTALKDISTRIEYLNSLANIKTATEHVDSLKDKVSDFKTRRDEILSQYINGIPNKKETDLLKEKSNENKLIREKINSSKPDDSKYSDFENYQKIFSKGTPHKKEIDDIIEIYNKISIEENNAKSQQSIIDDSRNNKNNIFIKKVTQEDIDSVKNNIENYNKCDKSLNDVYSEDATENSISEAKSKINPLYPVVAALGIIILIVGIILKDTGLLSTILLVLGICTVLATGFVFLLKKIENGQKSRTNQSATEKIQHQIEDIKSEKRVFSSNIQAVLTRYGYECNDVKADTQKFFNSIDNYNKESEKESIAIENLNQLNIRLNNMKLEVEAFYNKYSLDSYSKDSSGISKLSEDIIKYDNLKSDVETFESNFKKFTGQINENNDVINEILEKYKVDNIYSANEINDYAISADTNREKLDSLNSEIEALENEITEYVKTHNVGNNDVDLNEVSPEILNSLKNQKEELSKEVSSMISDIDKDEAQTGRITELEIKKSNLENEISEMEEKYFILTKTSEMIRGAENDMKDRFINPVKKSFVTLAAEVDGELSANTVMDKDFNVSYLKEGEPRSAKYLSQGQKCVENLCLRLAVLENIYNDDTRPFLILDDPFVFADENHMDKVADAVKKLSKKYQIIYFTCHKSRKID